MILVLPAEDNQMTTASTINTNNRLMMVRHNLVWGMCSANPNETRSLITEAAYAIAKHVAQQRRDKFFSQLATLQAADS